MKKSKRLLLGGGVVANFRLREKFREEFQKEGIRCYFPSRQLCLDNAAMVAGFAYQLFKQGVCSDLDLTACLQ